MENGSVPVRAGGLPAGWAAGAVVDLGAGDRVSVPLEPPAPATGQSPAAAPGSPDSPFRGRRAGRMRQAIRHGLLPIAGRLALAYLALTAVWAGLGLLLTGALAGTWVGPLDREVAGWLVGRRTPPLDGWSQVGSMLAETMVKVIVTAVIAVVMLLVWRSWHEPFLVSVALILEAAVFITVTSLVARPRPDVPALDEVSVGTSFPSGHAAAAAAYGAIAIVIFEHTRNTWIRTITIALVAAVPIIFGISRMYRVCTTSPT